MKSTRRSPHISIIGAGKVGSTLAVMLHKSGSKIVAVVSRNKRSARTCARQVACRNYSNDVSVVPSGCDLVVIAVPDRSIRRVAESLAALSHLEFGRTAVCHTSGALSSDVLEPLAHIGARVFSLHPIQTFPAKKPLRDQVRSMRGITYGYEGPRACLSTAKRITRRLGGELLVVPKEAKILYHLVCVIASNYPTALVGAVETIVGQFSRRGLQPFRKLIETSIDNAISSGAARALTGPIVRGDAAIVQAHLKAMSDPKLKALYKSLGLYALKLTSEEHRLPSKETKRLRVLLGSRT